MQCEGDGEGANQGKKSKSHTQFEQLAGNTEVNNIFQFIERNKLVSDKEGQPASQNPG